MPALLTTTSRRPNARTASSISAPAPSHVATSLVLATASPPAARTSSTTSWAGPASEPVPSLAAPTSLTTTFAPSRAKSSACSRPMPRPAPVMTVTRPSSAPMSDLLDLRQAVLDDHRSGVGARLVRVRAAAGVPDPGRDRLLGQARLREPDRQALQARRVLRARVLDHRPRGEGHRAQPVDDDPRQAHRLGELLVGVDRHRVARRRR